MALRGSIALVGCAAALVAVACQPDPLVPPPGPEGPDPDPADAGELPESDGGTGELTIVPPAPAALPVLVPCPDGWAEVPPDAEVGVARCEPWPAGREECEGARLQVPGAVGCVELGPPCPADGWPVLDGTGPVRHVRAGSPGGDGSRDTPFGTIGEALAGASAGDRISVAAGTYPETIAVPPQVKVEGACAGGTRLAAPTGSPAAVFLGSGAALRRMSVAGGGVIAGAGDEVAIEAVAIDGAAPIGLAVASGASVRGREVLVRGTLPVGPSEATGILVTAGGRLDLDGCVASGNLRLSVEVSGGAAVLSRCAVLDPRPQAGTGPTGLRVSAGGTLELHASVVAGAARLAVEATGAGSSLLFEDSVIESVVRDKTARDVVLGRALEVRDGASAVLRRARASDLASAGVFVDATAGAPAHARLEDVVVHHVAQGEGGSFEQATGALTVLGDASVEVDRALFAQAALYSVSVSSSQPVLLHDVTVRYSGGASLFYALLVFGGDRVEGRRLDLVHGTMSSCYFGDADVSMEDVEIHPRGDGRRSPGVIAFGRLEAVRVRIAGTRLAALLALGEDAHVTARELSVHDKIEPCEGEACWAAFYGVVAASGARLEASRFRISHADPVGVQVATGASMDLHEGEVSHCRIGANVQVDGFDVLRLADRVAYRDNEANLSSDSLPVPSAPPPLW